MMASNQIFYIKFFAPVIPETVARLMQIVDEKVKQGAKKLGLLISTPGGDVFHGLSVYNYLKGIPLEITTHNFGSADSIGVVLFCAGSKRLSVPHARFLLHGVQCNFNQPVSLEEKQLEERLKGLQIDMGNIARIIAYTVKKDKQQVLNDMLNRTTLYPEQAVEYGLVHEIKSELFESGAEVISIQMAPQPATPSKEVRGSADTVPIALEKEKVRYIETG
jgi:ATP-dependent protease ClpP protease subunit